jgi:succinoglycan biosynthesis protein ExoV
VGFMPHYASTDRYDWRSVCADAGLEFLDARGDFKKTLEQMANLRLILTEAMHGAIVADALRVPWLPLQITPTTYVGKWHDWSASIRVPIHFKPLPTLYDPLHQKSALKLLRTGLRPALYELRQGSGPRARARAVHLLRRYAEDYQPYLSDERDLDRSIDAVRSRIAVLT